MEWVLIAGLVAVVALVALAGFVMLQRRRAGTVKAVVAPHRGANRAETERSGGAGADDEADVR